MDEITADQVREVSEAIKARREAESQRKWHEDAPKRAEYNARMLRQAAAGELLEACKAARLALRATSAAEKDYSHELKLLNAAIENAEGHA